MILGIFGINEIVRCRFGSVFLPLSMRRKSDSIQPDGEVLGLTNTATFFRLEKAYRNKAKKTLSAFIARRRQRLHSKGVLFRYFKTKLTGK
jgi:hypothetical protein